MALKTIYPHGSADIIVPATESIAISNFGGGIAKIYYLIESSNTPPAFQFQQTLDNSSIVLGAFAAETIVRIESNNSTVIYDVATAPDTGVGDADTLGGNPPSYYATDSDVVHDTGNETVAGIKTLTSALFLESTSPSIRLNETDSTTRGFLNQDNGYFKIQASTTGYTGSGSILFSGFGEVDINSFKVRHSGSYRNIYHEGLNPSLADGNGVSGSFTTVDGKTVTVTNGIITAIV